MIARTKSQCSADLFVGSADPGWNTDHGARALSNLQRFGSVTALNGYIH